MAIHADELETILRAAFPDAEITVAGSDGVHMSAMVIDESFRGKNRVQQQRAVYAALQGKMDGPMASSTRLPSQQKPPNKRDNHDRCKNPD